LILGTFLFGHISSFQFGWGHVGGFCLEIRYLNRELKLGSAGVFGRKIAVYVAASVKMQTTIFVASWCLTLLKFCAMLGYCRDIASKVAFHPRVQFLFLGPS